ncbi:putative Polycomb group protein ASXL2 isoform X2 [Pimephales promelas]|uniref:putative Polycomb group protein ASXL2 isoform X2 n=1 Tax=Pimephales promelas TaxID=90988 RepID=UPI001955BAE6|nr:putative Polycomb group protein ASXL2 isoform X2 [Pimephales promelas]KAG1972386.1 putative Polycomb group protein ASXL2 [Pimephales promelas]KAG1972387.1 putative Polycomb group protein ASXL2 [Pimephales promelas]
MRERQKKKKGRTWAEAAKTVLEKYPNTPMSHKEILQVIQRERLKEISGTSPLACLNAMLHTNSRGDEGIFYKVPGRMGVYTLKKDIGDVMKELSEEDSEDSSDNMSDTRCSENTSTTTYGKDGRRGRWKRRVPTKLQSQPSSPQSRCSSPSVSSSKLMSPSQKHSKKALKQALKQQQQRNQRRQCGIPSASSPRLLLKTVKDVARDSSKSSWELKQTECRPASPQNSTSSSSSSVKADVCHATGARKVSQRSSRLSARQLRRTKCEIDVETPDSILVNTNLRALINKHTFSLLPTECQQKLLKMLPDVDQQASIDGALKVTSSALNNEFFTSAAQSWKERLSEGEFTPELRLRMRQEIEKEKKVELWKEHFFESYYGEHSGLSIEESKELTESMDIPEPAKSSVLSVKPEIVKESQKINPVTEVIHMELRSRDVKSTVTHTSPEEPVKPPASEQSRLSLDVRKDAQEELISESSVQKAVDSKPCSEKTLEIEITCKPPASPLEAVVTCLKGKETQTTKEESSVGNAEQITENDKAGSPITPVTSEPLKRKFSTELDTELRTEKKPRVSLSETSSTVTDKEKVEQRVPPLKIPVSRILSAPASIEQVSPRTPVPLTPPSIRPGRTGARTLADIKAKAQLARAQRAAAAAAGSSSSRGTGSVGGTSTPSPARSLSEDFSPASSRSQSVSPIKLSSESPAPEGTVTLSQTSPSSGFTGHTDPGFVPDFTAQGFLKENRSLMGSQTTQCALKDQHNLLSPGGTPAPSSQAGHNTIAQNQRPQQTPFSGALVTKPSSSIPANNPLVTQLLQGKEVPLEKILPKPLAQVEVHSMAISAKDKGNLGTTTAGFKRDSPTNQDDVSKLGNQIPFCSSVMQVQSMDKLVKVGTQDQMLHPLMLKCEQKHTNSDCQPSKFQSCQLGHIESSLDQSVHLGIFGRKRLSKPAMTGHYLLNVSTYGRVSESSKRPHLAGNTTLANLKKEKIEAEESVKGKTESLAGSQGHLNFSRVKVEQQGCFINNKPDDVLGSQPCSDIKSESPSVSCLSSKEGDSTSTRTKEICSKAQLDIQDKTERYQLSDCHQRTFLSQKAHNGPQYGGTISMSVPNALNHSMADAPTSPTVSCSGDGETASGGMMSFSVTVTAIPAGHLLDQSSQGETSPEQAYMETSGMEDVQSKCYCRLKAMIMCKGCGAFCHDDCIGPSKLCVSCLVVR